MHGGGVFRGNWHFRFLGEFLGTGGEPGPGELEGGVDGNAEGEMEGQGKRESGTGRQQGIKMEDLLEK